MRVVMVSKHYFPFLGGLESRVKWLAEWLVHAGDQVTVVTAAEEGVRGSECLEGVTVNRHPPAFSLLNALVCPGVLRDLLKLDYDVADVNLPDPVNAVFTLIACTLRRRPYVVTYHADIHKTGFAGRLFTFFYSPLQQLVLTFAHAILVTSPDYAHSSAPLKPHLGKTVVAPSFVNADRFTPNVDGTRMRAELGVTAGKMVLFVGRLVPYKGLDVLLDAFRRVASDVDATLVIAGEGPLESRLKAQAQTLGVANRVVFAGRVPDERLPELYAACDVFVLPSVTRQEAFGLVLVEALACGKPAVTTNFSGMPYVVGDAGLKVPPGSVGQLHPALVKLLVDGEAATKMGAAGRQRVLELFEQNRVAEKVAGVYRRAVG